MSEIKVLGSGCPKCQQLFDNFKQVIEELGLDCTVEKITDIVEITNYGVLMTPSIVIDGEVIVSGKVLSIDEIKKLLV